MTGSNRRSTSGTTLAAPLLAGLIALLPLVLTVMVTTWLARTIHQFVGPGSEAGGALQRLGLNFATSDEMAYALGILLVVALIYVLGLVVQSGLKHRWHSLVDQVVARIPLVNSVYSSSRKVASLFESAGEDELRSMTPVLCTFGGQGGAAIPALMPSSDTIRISGIEYKTVMIPTAPIPLGGAILCVPAEWLTPMNCGLEGLLSIYMSMGVSSSEHLGEASPDSRSDESS